MNHVRKAHERGNVVHLQFFWLECVELAKQRVAERVACGGHNIPMPVIERRYKAGIKNLFELYMREADVWVLYDNNGKSGVRLAFGGRNVPTRIKDVVKFGKIKDYE